MHTGTKCKARVIARSEFASACANTNLAQSVNAELHLVLRLFQVTLKYELVPTGNQSRARIQL